VAPCARAGVTCRDDYCFGAEAAEAADDAASAAELAAAAESAAAEAADSEAGAVELAGGGVVSLVGAGASVLLPQALRTSAAQKAQSASLVFIYRYPRNLMVKRFGDVLSWAVNPVVTIDFRVFPLNFLSLSPTWTPCNLGRPGIAGRARNRIGLGLPKELM
jgi:hypothetical protein